MQTHPKTIFQRQKHVENLLLDFPLWVVCVADAIENVLCCTFAFGMESVPHYSFCRLFFTGLMLCYATKIPVCFLHNSSHNIRPIVYVCDAHHRQLCVNRCVGNTEKSWQRACGIYSCITSTFERSGGICLFVSSAMSFSLERHVIYERDIWSPWLW